jgi:AcrR family transcriptional regulator
MSESAAPRSSLRDEQKALTRRRLIDAAESVFARRGFHGASVEEIAREAGATTGALYSNFASKEELFLALFDETLATDVRGYSEAFETGATPEEKGRAAADRWMQVLHERPSYFPLFVEFWTYAVREPRMRERFAERLATLRESNARLVERGAWDRGFPPNPELAGRLGLVIAALGNGLALEKLVDPDAVPDELYGDMLALIFEGLAALARGNPDATGHGFTGDSREADQGESGVEDE